MRSTGYAHLQSGFFSLGLAIAFFVARHPLRQIGQSLKDEMVPLLDSGNALQWSDLWNKICGTRIKKWTNYLTSVDIRFRH